MFHVIRTSPLHFRWHMVVPGPSDTWGKLKHLGDPRECESDMTAEAAKPDRGIRTGTREGGGSAWNPGFPPPLAPLQQKAPFAVPVRTQHRGTARTQSSAPSRSSAGLPASVEPASVPAGCRGRRPLPTRAPVRVQLQPWWSPRGPSLLLTRRPKPALGAAQTGPPAALSRPASPGPGRHGPQFAAAVLKLLPSRTQHWGVPRVF